MESGIEVNGMTDNSIDLVLVIRKVFRERKLIFISVLVMLSLGALLTLNMKEIYTSRIVLISQKSIPRASSSALGIAALTGFNIDNNLNDGLELSPSVYPRIVRSPLFKIGLLNSTIIINDEEYSLSEYFLDFQNNSSFRNFLNPSIDYINSEFDDQIYEFNDLELNMLNKIDTALSLFFSDSDGTLIIEYSDENRLIATQVVKNAKVLLERFLIEHKNRNAVEAVEIAEIQYLKYKESYNLLHDSIANFRDRNINISSSLYRNKLERLRREVEISYSVLNQLASNLEAAKLKVNQNSKVFTTIEPATVPINRSSPNRRLILILSCCIAIILSVSYILLKDYCYEIYNSIRQ